MKKKLNITLLILVFGLWGTVIYKYVSQYLVSKDLVNNSQQEVAHHQIAIKGKDTFDLKPLNRDPFLNKSYSVSNKAKTTTKKRSLLNSSKNLIVQPKANFPDIKYFGYIKPLNGNGELILIKVNGKLLKLKNNEVKEGLKVVKIFKDSIKIFYNKETRIIKK